MPNGENLSVIERLLDPLSRCLTSESVRAPVKMKADPVVAQARIEELAARCNEGSLTPEEEREYETYVHIGNVIAILRAKARLHLKKRPSA